MHTVYALMITIYPAHKYALIMTIYPAHKYALMITIYPAHKQASVEGGGEDAEAFAASVGWPGGKGAKQNADGGNSGQTEGEFAPFDYSALVAAEAAVAAQGGKGKTLAASSQGGFV